MFLSAHLPNVFLTDTVPTSLLSLSTYREDVPLERHYSLSSLLMKLVIRYLLLGFCMMESIKSIACSNVY